jgi:hypothetical protein
VEGDLTRGARETVREGGGEIEWAGRVKAGLGEGKLGCWATRVRRKVRGKMGRQRIWAGRKKGEPRLKGEKGRVWVWGFVFLFFKPFQTFSTFKFFSNLNTTKPLQIILKTFKTSLHQIQTSCN